MGYVLKLLLRTLEDVAFKKEGYSQTLYRGDVHSRVMLTLGAVCQKLRQEGQQARAQSILNGFHNQLGMHGKSTCFSLAKTSLVR